MPSSAIFYECVSEKCHWRCILAVSNDQLPKNCPYLEWKDEDNAKWEQVWDKMSITRKY